MYTGSGWCSHGRWGVGSVKTREASPGPQSIQDSLERSLQVTVPSSINGPGNIVTEVSRWPQVPREAGINTLPKYKTRGPSPAPGQSVVEGCLWFLLPRGGAPA